MWTSKIDRAKHLKKEMEMALQIFFASQPYKIDTKTDAQSKRLIYYVTRADTVPVEIALITGDVIQNLRSALDHLAYKLFTLYSGNGTSGSHIYFPIVDNFAQYEREKGGKTRGIAQQAKVAIDTIRPYHGGNDTLWKIHKLNIIDKHRLLVTVGSSFGSMDLGAHLQDSMQRNFPHLQVPAMPFFVKPAENLFPLKAGDELFSDIPDAKPVPTMQFKFDIVIHEPDIIEGEPVVEMLQGMIDAVTSLIPIFEPFMV
jgi:hypothetical protein